MKVGDVEIEYFIDYIGQRVHILDKEFGSKLVNSITPSWIIEFIELESLLMDCLEFDWICYTIDYLVSYKNYNFKIISPKVPYVHEPYMKEIETRRKKRYGH